METLMHVDTHVGIWLWIGDEKRLKHLAPLIYGQTLLISPMVVLEIQYLYELGRVTESSNQITTDLIKQFGIYQVDVDWKEVCQRACTLTWTRDPFDRLITATAEVEQCPLLTGDGTILQHSTMALWYK